MRRTLALTLVLLAGSAGLATAQRRPVPTPASVLGFAPGTDRRLVEWGPITDYFRALDAASDRVSVRTLGRSTNGLPFIAVFISSAANIQRLPALRDAQRRLADPRLSPDSTTASRLAAQTPAFTLITSAVHATEVGGFAPDVEAELRKMEACDLMIWQFPLWWFGQQAIWFIWFIWFVLFIWLIWFIWLVSFNQKTRQTK
jgi:hypothetical protein